MTDISLGFSSCPNDTWIFHALVHGMVDTGRYNITPHIADVEELNNLALDDKIPVTKMSFHAWLHLRESWQLLDSGAALGYGCGPLLVTAETDKPLEEMTVAIPGKYTTAYMLLQLWNNGLTNIEVARFDQVMPGIVDGRWDAGVIIHEGRFVYQQFGLHQVVDLGQWWEDETGQPIPLGCIAMKKGSVPGLDGNTMSGWIRESLLYARSHPEDSRNYIRSLAQELDDEVTRQHIELYVNDFSLSLGDRGREAVKVLETMAKEKGIIT